MGTNLSDSAQSVEGLFAHLQLLCGLLLLLLKTCKYTLTQAKEVSLYPTSPW